MKKKTIIQILKNIKKIESKIQGDFRNLLSTMVQDNLESRKIKIFTLNQYK